MAGPKKEYDVIVIGGGVNGLATAAYLQKAGMSVAVFEKRDEAGTFCATEETLFPGYYTNPHAVYHMMTDYMPLFRDFDSTNVRAKLPSPTRFPVLVAPSCAASGEHKPNPELRLVGGDDQTGNRRKHEGAHERERDERCK